MAISTRVIKGRIKSIKSTKKITKAMELVSAAKMRKAVDRALASRLFSQYTYDVLCRILAGDETIEHPLLHTRSVKKIVVVLSTSHRGLVGGLNTNLFSHVMQVVQNPHTLAMHRMEKHTEKIIEQEQIEIEYVAIGRKGEQMIHNSGLPLVASFQHVSDMPTLDEVRPLTEFLLKSFVAGTYDKIVLAYSDFISAVAQKPRVRQLLPVSLHDIEKMIAQLTRSEPLMEAHEEKKVKGKDETDYEFEPSQEEVLRAMIPKIALTHVYQAILEARASEHSARMVAMKNASDAAGDIIDDLQNMFNKVRQAKITQEIAEISAGKAAVE